jgi:hypothetical protein
MYSVPCPYYDGLFMDDPHYERKLEARRRRDGLEPLPKEAPFRAERVTDIPWTPMVKGSSKLKRDQVKEIRLRHKLGESQANLAREFRISPANISNIVLNKIWRYT